MGDVASRRSETMDLEENEEVEEILLPNTNIITHCIYKNLPQRLIKCFEDDTDKFKEQALECLNKRDADGKSPLDIAAQLGRLEITRELLARGADVNSFTPKGYSCLHYAAAWGRMKVLRLHVENGGNVTQRNAHGERPRETAERYSQEECVLYLDWAEAKHLLSEAIKATQESILEADKAVAGRISKDEKNIILNTCKEKMEWLETTQDASTQDFISHRIALTEITAPILLKLSEPAPEKGSAAPQKGKKKGK